MPQSEQEFSSVVAEVASRPFNFAPLPQLVQEQIVNNLGLPEWFAFMQASKASFALAFNHQAIYQRIMSVLLTLTSLDGMSLEVLLTYFRASPAYQELCNIVKRSPESVTVAQWFAYIHSATSLDQLKNGFNASGFNNAVVNLLASEELNEDVKQFAVLTKRYLRVIQGTQKVLSDRYYINRLFEELIVARSTRLTQPLPNDDQFDEIISTLITLTEDGTISEAIHAAEGMMRMGFALINGIFTHDTPLSRLMLMGISRSEGNLCQYDLCYGNLQHANLSSSFLFEMLCRHADFRHANLSASNLGNADFYSADLRNANLQRVFFILGNLSRANLSGASLQRAYLGAANLTKAILVSAQLQKADLSLAKLNDANFSLADMQNIIIKKAEMRETNLRGANMAGALLAHMRMQVDLTSATLSGATLIDIDLAGAILIDVVWQGATLKRVNLKGAKVLGVKQDHLLDIENLRARLDILCQFMKDQLIPAVYHDQFRRCATDELITCVEAHEEISPDVRIHCLEAVIQHPIFANATLLKLEKALNYSIGLFAPNQIAIRSENQQVIADCLLRLQADLVIRPEC
jgi:uncharacterized protein YjbI with pentapeptide repeats